MSGENSYFASIRSSPTAQMDFGHMNDFNIPKRKANKGSWYKILRRQLKAQLLETSSLKNCQSMRFRISESH